jgi:hypothetical protein
MAVLPMTTQRIRFENLYKNLLEGELPELPDGDVKEIFLRTLNCQYENRPKILARVSSSNWDRLRCAAAALKIVYLKGIERSVGGPLHDNFETDTACRMLLFWASNNQTLETTKRLGFREVEIGASDNGCSHCRRRNGLRYSVHQAPELPDHLCREPRGCRCLFFPIIELP